MKKRPRLISLPVDQKQISAIYHKCQEYQQALPEVVTTPDENLMAYKYVLLAILLNEGEVDTDMVLMIMKSVDQNVRDNLEANEELFNQACRTVATMCVKPPNK